MRFFATILVVLGHSCYLAIATPGGGVDYALDPNIHSIFYSDVFNMWLNVIPAWLYTFHMPLFFILSGAVFALKPMPKIDDFVYSKIKRLIFPFLGVGIFYMIPVKTLGNFYSTDGLPQAICGFIMGNELGHLWFLPALFWCMLIFGIIYKLLNRVGCNSVYVILFCSLVIQLTYNYIPFDIMCFKKGLSYIFWYGVGFAFEKEKERYAGVDLRVFIIFAIVVLWIGYHYLYLGNYSRIIVGTLTIFVISVLFQKYFRWILETKIWKINLRNLFYIYLFHDPLEYIMLRIFMNSSYLQSAVGCILYMLSRTIGVWIISLIFGEITEYMIQCTKKYLTKGKISYI